MDVRDTAVAQEVLGRGLQVYSYPQVYPYSTRTRGSGTGRIGVSRVGYG